MHDLLFYLAAVNLAVVAVIALDQHLGQRSIASLAAHPLPPAGPRPPLSIVVAARNEEQHVEAAMRSLLQLDYDHLEIIAVDDRSTDRTGEILDALAEAHPRLAVVHIGELPRGWLGKNHALHRGARRARGELLLFTDADVVMDRTTLQRAIAYLLENDLDHLALTPATLMPNWLLESFVAAFVVFFSVHTRPWRARDANSSRYIGIGAFNLVRTRVYRAIGGHERIAMRPDDDLMLGKLIKRGGYRQDVANGSQLISVPWYGSLRQLAVGLEKNAFAGFGYRLSAVAGLTAVILAFDAWPFLAVWLPLGAARWLYAAAALLLVWLAWQAANLVHVRRSSALAFPLAVLLFVYIVWRSALLAVRRQGVQWRGAFYRLDELKANKL